MIVEAHIVGDKGVVEYLFKRNKEAVRPELEAMAVELGFTIVEDAVEQAVLVEATEKAAANLRRRLPDWIVSKETTHAPPSPAEHRIRQRDSDTD